MPEEVWMQTVAPNRAGQETLFTLLAALVIVMLSALTVCLNQRPMADVNSLATFEISSRYDLVPAEQGIYTDLLLVYEDWLVQNPSESNPDIATLLVENWPPFTDVIEQKQRGDHEWKTLDLDGRTAYLGVTHDKHIARHFLWILPPSRQVAALSDFSVWVAQDDASLNIEQATLDTLPELGWQKVHSIDKKE